LGKSHDGRGQARRHALIAVKPGSASTVGPQRGHWRRPGNDELGLQLENEQVAHSTIADVVDSTTYFAAAAAALGVVRHRNATPTQSVADPRVARQSTRNARQLKALPAPSNAMISSYAIGQLWLPIACGEPCPVLL
jgi:hypothetical protein